MIENRDFIIVGLQPWDIAIGSNCKNIATELSKKNRVLYVNTPLDRITSIRDKHLPEVQRRKAIIAGKENGLIKVSDNLWTLYPSFITESINKLPAGWLYNLLNKRNNKRFAREIKKILGQLGFKNVILFNDSLMFQGFYLKELLDPALAIYYIRDNLVTQPYFKKHGEAMEPALAAKYDVVVSNSDYLAQCLRPSNSKSFMIGQGCDFTLFDFARVLPGKPDDLKDIPTPVIGYVGFLTGMRLDIKLLEYLATNRKKYSFVLVGPEDEEFKASALHHYPNIYFLGAKSEGELVQYVNAFDVCINPQLNNGMTIGNYPRKIDEYLAMGKPTVATKNETMAFFKEHVYLSEGYQHYATHLDEALQTDTEQKKQARIAFARGHTWANSVSKLYEVIEKENK